MARSIVTVSLTLCLLTALVPLTVADDPAAPVLVEVQPTPPGHDYNDEWVEFHNPLPIPLSLEGLYLRDDRPCGESDLGLPLEGTIQPGAYLKVMLPHPCLQLKNTGDFIELVTDGDHVLQRVAWGGQGTLETPSEADSLTACRLASNLHGSWQHAQATPGGKNPGC